MSKFNANKFVEILEGRIVEGRYATGSKLPGVRNLVEEFDVSTHVAYQGLRKLQEKSLIELRHGSGAYVSYKRANGAKSDTWNITLFANNEYGGMGYLVNAFLGIQEEAMKHNCAITSRKRDYFAYHVPEPELSTQIDGADGLIFLGEYDYLDIDVPRHIPSCGMEMVNTYGGVLSPVVIDPLTAAELAADFFVRRGKTRVQVYFAGGVRFSELQAAEFARIFQEHGSVEFVEYGIGDREGNCDKLDHDKGVLFSGGTYCNFVMDKYWKKFRRKMTDDFTVLSIDGKSLVMPEYHPVSTLWVDWRAAGRMALNELLRRLKEPGARACRIGLQPELKEF